MQRYTNTCIKTDDRAHKRTTTQKMSHNIEDTIDKFTDDPNVDTMYVLRCLDEHRVSLRQLLKMVSIDPRDVDLLYADYPGYVLKVRECDDLLRLFSVGIVELVHAIVYEYPNEWQQILKVTL